MFPSTPSGMRPRLFVFTFGSGYIQQQAVVQAFSRSHAIIVLEDAMRHGKLRFETVVDFSPDALLRGDDGEIDVRVVDDLVALTYGVDG